MHKMYLANRIGRIKRYKCEKCERTIEIGPGVWRVKRAGNVEVRHYGGATWIDFTISEGRLH